MSSSFKIRLCAWVHAWRSWRNRSVARQVVEALRFVSDPIPCFVVCYNNAAHLSQMVEQLNAKGLTPIVFDNASTCPATKDLLKRIHRSQAYVIAVGKNARHKVGFLPGIYDQMPRLFAYTDPDLVFDSALPLAFLDQLASLTDEYQVFKAGCALTLDAHAIDEQLSIRKRKCGSMPFAAQYSVAEWEGQFWKFQLQRTDPLLVYAAPLDTTFAVYNKAQFKGAFMDAVRVAGPFAVVHVPWFPALNLMTPEEKRRYLMGNRSSTWM